MLTVAATQFACSWDRAANLASAERVVRAAAAAGAQVVLVQELFETPYFCVDHRYDYQSLAVPLAEIEIEVQSRLKHIGRTAKMPGFRPGKVPFKVVQQQYGAQVRQEVLGATIEKSFGDAVREQNLRVAGYPKFDPATPADGAAEFQYSATFEVYPEIAVGDISGKSIECVALEVGDAEVDKTLEIMRKQRVTFDAADKAAENGDQLQISYVGTIDGTPFDGGKADNQYVVLGEGRLLPDFEKNLAGTKAGEKKSFELKFPDDYHGKDVAGKTARFDVTVSAVAVPKLPPMTGVSKISPSVRPDANTN